MGYWISEVRMCDFQEVEGEHTGQENPCWATQKQWDTGGVWLIGASEALYLPSPIQIQLS